ncbi:MAG: HAD-IA family hydrolase [Gammaproteobacteria bacterium]
MNRLQAIIFDVDGTLADTEEVHRLAFNHVFAEFGLDWNWTPELYEELLAISGGRERITAYGRDLRGRFAGPAEFDDFVRTVHRAKTRKYAAMLTEGEVPLRPGIRRLIDEARAAGLVLAIATSSALTNAETLLDNNLPPGWRDWFSAVETCDSVVNKKPSPAVYNAVLARLDIDLDAIVALEDTRNGLLAASAAGLTTVVTTHRFTRGHDFTGAALVVDGAGEPDAPFTVAAGDAHGRRWVDLPLLDALLEDVAATRPPARVRASA